MGPHQNLVLRLKTVFFSHDGLKFFIVSEKEDIFVYEYVEEEIEKLGEDANQEVEFHKVWKLRSGLEKFGIFTAFQQKKSVALLFPTFFSLPNKINTPKSVILDATISFDNSTLAILTKATIKIIDLDAKTTFQSGSNLIKNIQLPKTFTYKNLKFLTNRFFRHYLVILMQDQNDVKQHRVAKINVIACQAEKVDPNIFENSQIISDQKRLKLEYQHNSSSCLVFNSQICFKYETKNLELAEIASTVAAPSSPQEASHENKPRELTFCSYNDKIISINSSGCNIALTPEEMTDQKFVKNLGGCELSSAIDHYQSSANYAASLLPKPKTAQFFMKDQNQNFTPHKSFDADLFSKNTEILGNLKARRHKSVLQDSNLLEIPVNFDLNNLNVGEFCSIFF